jgi:hypothetical protein
MFSCDFVYDRLMIETTAIDGLKRNFNRLGAKLGERGRRWWAASEALESKTSGKAGGLKM